MSGTSLPRRRAIKSLFAAGAGIVALRHGSTGTAYAATASGTEVTHSFEPIKVGRVGKLSTGTPEFFDFPDENHTCMLIKLGRRADGGVGPDEDIVAFSTSCPHMGCGIRDVDKEQSLLGPCRCHFSCFDLARRGRQVQGQATQSAPQIQLRVEDDAIYAVGISGLLYGRATNLAESSK